MNSNSRGLAVVVATLGLAAVAPFAGCGGDEPSEVPATSSSGAGGSGGTGGGGEGGGQMLNCVLDGTVVAPEQCDDGNEIGSDGCETDCTFTCMKDSPVLGDAKCDDTDPCNGAETCTDKHTCAPGKPVADGTECGKGKVCKASICVEETCGDGFVSGAEECDDGNLADGDGCDACQFSCLKSDPARDCTTGDPCQGTTCDEATHTCANPLPEGQGCGADAVCKGGACTPTVCGDGMMEGSEICDDGNLANGDGCDADCTLSCVDAATDCAAAPVCQIAVCDGTNQCSNAPDASKNGQACGVDLICKDGACVAPDAVCGNGKLENGEDCDFGASNGAGTGCEATCKFSCTLGPDSCPDAETCNGVETCLPVTVNGQLGQKCSAGMPVSDCSACMGGVCSMGSCKPSQCGDGCVDGSAGEQCDPPSTPTCSAACKTVICGNAVRDPGEQCDDGNTTNLDGCDALCKFEQDHRVNYLKMQFVTDTFCTANALGVAISGLGQSQLQTSLDEGITDGNISIMFKLLGLDDLSGTSDPQVDLGLVDGGPFLPMGAMYDGNLAPDWWYAVEAFSLDASRNPTAKLLGNINAKTLTAGPGTVTLKLLLGGKPAPLKMSETRVTGIIGATNTPAVSASSTPGHLASEHLDPALVSFATMGQKTTNGAGKLCGNVTAASLANVPIPDALVTGLSACSQGYAATNSLLDVYVNGCTVFFSQVIKPTQPDKVDAAAPVAGAGGLYKLSVDPATKAVSTCRDKNNAVVDLPACLNAAAYSSFFKIATERVILK